MIGQYSSHILAQGAGTFDERTPICEVLGMAPPNEAAQRYARRVSGQSTATANDDWAVQARARFSALTDYTPASHAERTRLPSLVTKLICEPPSVYRTDDPVKLACLRYDQYRRYRDWLEAEPLRRRGDRVMQPDGHQESIRAAEVATASSDAAVVQPDVTPA